MHCGDFFSDLGDARKSVNDNWGDVQEDGVWWKLRHCSDGSVQPQAEGKTGQSQHTGRVLPSLHFQSCADLDKSAFINKVLEIMKLSPAQCCTGPHPTPRPSFLCSELENQNF